MSDSKKKYIDRLRVLATFAVVMIHICMTEVENSSLSEIGARNYAIYSVGYNLVRWAVPVFIMITGFLLLPAEKELPEKKLKHYIARMFLTLFVFGTVYAAMEIVFDSGLQQLYLLIPRAILRVLQMKSWDHLWYLYCLLGLYIMTPFVKAAVKNIKEREIWILLCVLFCLDFFIPAINMITGKQFTIFYISANQYFFYFLMGYFLSIENNRIVRNRKIVYVAGCISLILMCIWDVYKIYQYGDYSHWIRKANFLIPPMAISIFTFFLSNKMVNGRESRVLKSISRCSFGIYLIHPFYVNLFFKVLHIMPTSFPIVLGIAFLFFIVFVAAWLSTWIAIKIPLFNKIL